MTACCEGIRYALESDGVRVPGTDEPLGLTISVGLTAGPGASIDAMINTADALLYQAKKKGRNLVVC